MMDKNIKFLPFEVIVKCADGQIIGFKADYTDVHVPNMITFHFEGMVIAQLSVANISYWRKAMEGE